MRACFGGVQIDKRGNINLTGTGYQDSAGRGFVAPVSQYVVRRGVEADLALSAQPTHRARLSKTSSS